MLFRSHDPKRNILAHHLLHLGEPALLHVRNVNVPLEGGRFDEHAQLLAQETGEGVDEVIRALVAVVDERILALDDFHIRRVLIQGCEVRIVFPQAGARGAHVREELAGTAGVQIPHRRREHHEVARRLGVAEEEFSFHGIHA